MAKEYFVKIENRKQAREILVGYTEDRNKINELVKKYVEGVNGEIGDMHFADVLDLGRKVRDAALKVCLKKQVREARE